ncbi:dicer-like 3 [Striga asiatica]|uniref:Dicer-like 3 n=1 Tax=Striga asiatica TaxID=4170 RepID=A0A5A7PI03_STRAF|nr:dicer-like 3 [Striga asiatica]
MELTENAKPNSLKRSFDSFNSSQHETTEPMDTDTAFAPSDYDMKVFEVAMRRNTIALIDAGPRKNLFVARIIREIGKSLKDNAGGKRLIVFLVPTQYEEIKSRTELHVDEYYGARGVDGWTRENWEKEIHEHDVLIMTPQIFLNALRKSLLSFKTFCFIILDECHRATGKHPYARIMEEFYHKCTKRPKILGMTALSMIRKGFSPINNSKEHIVKLERLLDCRVYMLEDEVEVEECKPTIKPICRFYEPMQPAYLELKAKLQNSWSKFDAVLLGLKKSLPDQYTERSSEYKQLLEKLSNEYTGVLFCLENLGLLCSYEAVKVCMETAPAVQEECEVYKESLVEYEKFLQEALLIIEGSHEYKKLSCLMSGDTLSSGQISSKLLELLELIRSFGKDQEALYIVLFEKIIAAKVIERVVKKIADFSDLNISYLTGRNFSTELPSKAQKVNLLFSTDIIEEGSHVGKFSSVICFDLPKTVGSYVQSRGLAREKDSQYIIMLESALIQEPKFESLMDGNLYRCKLILPPNAAFETAIGPLARKFDLSKQLACLEACKKLHMMGALDDHLVPCYDLSSYKDCASNEKSSNSGAGTTKRKELHGSVTVRNLSGTWGGKPNYAKFHAYKMDFCCSIAEQRYSSFVLLLEMKLDDDVGNLEVDLYLLSKSVKANVSSVGQVYLNPQQMENAKCFQELMFNGLFGKLFVKSSGERKFLLQTEESLWDPSNMYLLLPLDDENATGGQPSQINWTGIESCVSAVEFLTKNALLDFKQPKTNDDPDSSVNITDLVVNDSDCDVIHLANTSATADGLKEMVVVAIHTGRIYSILNTVDNTSSRSPFEGDVDLEYSSYADYYNKKYGIVLKYPEQPLVLLKQSHSSHNLLVDFQNEGPLSKNKTKGGKKVTERKPQQHAHMPPELLVSINIRTDILKPYYLLPSLMHRLESLMLASQLREEISRQAGNITITSSLDYVRDVPFDSRRWTAPGQRSIWSSPCKHGVETAEVPLNDSKFWSDDIKLMLGKPCDMGHRWISSKTVSDCVEALIGAYYVAGGFSAAFCFMRWLGFEIETEHSLVKKAVCASSLYSHGPRDQEIGALESKIGYEFETKGLLIEAVTHESEREQGFCYSYERLEFLGDAVLDVLMTCHLYENNKNVDPGMLTDLRSASVNNDNFALAAVRYNLHTHIRHSSLHIDDQVLSFCESVSRMSTVVLTPDNKAPKVLGDLVESIAGAVLIDSKLDLDKVWRVFKPLLSPIVTPDKLELPPTRELIELCDSLGYFIKEHIARGEIMHAVLKLQLEDVLLEGQGSGPNSKAAKGMAAIHLLKELESRGIKSSKSRQELENVDGPLSPSSADNNISCGSAMEKQKQLQLQPTIKVTSDIENADIPVLPPIEMKKGGPRIALYALCKQQQWPMPTFETTEQKSRKPVIHRTPMQLGDTMGFNSFESRISLTIPDFGKIELTGEARADKKSSYDTAAVLTLHELERRGKITIAKSN